MRRPIIWLSTLRTMKGMNGGGIVESPATDSPARSAQGPGMFCDLDNPVVVYGAGNTASQSEWYPLPAQVSPAIRGRASGSWSVPTPTGEPDLEPGPGAVIYDVGIAENTGQAGASDRNNGRRSPVLLSRNPGGTFSG